MGSGDTYVIVRVEIVTKKVANLANNRGLNGALRKMFEVDGTGDRFEAGGICAANGSWVQEWIVHGACRQALTTV